MNHLSAYTQENFTPDQFFAITGQPLLDNMVRGSIVRDSVARAARAGEMSALDGTNRQQIT